MKITTQTYLDNFSNTKGVSEKNYLKLSQLYFKYQEKPLISLPNVSEKTFIGISIEEVETVQYLSVKFFGLGASDPISLFKIDQFGKAYINNQFKDLEQSNQYLNSILLCFKNSLINDKPFKIVDGITEKIITHSFNNKLDKTSKIRKLK